ncbi:hypothetical protein GOODEAATRI_000594 [Goodea atripinnis]|uniref:Family with sequence similarity 107 member B n=1 Tax=Goodea atripinnis TaxID=208336 RepID=A0ABV0NQR6_9TELE
MFLLKISITIARMATMFRYPVFPHLQDPGRSVMAEPDYLEGDCDELIQPKKLINPVKGSRNHQDLHRELIMNQKRSGKNANLSVPPNRCLNFLILICFLAGGISGHLCERECTCSSGCDHPFGTECLGLAPQNKPELQKVLEKRKREQVIKAQKEEQEAHKKRSDLEIELMKRQQKLEQLELEQQKIQEEQENTPEFVKMKGNLRRTKQEADGEQGAT